MTDSRDRAFARRVTGRPHTRRVRPSPGQPLRQVQEADLREWLEPNLLTKADRFGMADHVEIRVPFLRPKIVATALALPPGRKVSGSVMKLALKDAFRDLLPDYVTKRPKQGGLFTTMIVKRPGQHRGWSEHDRHSKMILLNNPQGFPCPIGQWLRGGEMGHALRASATWSVADMWSVETEQELWREHLDGRRDWGQQLWRLAVARAWGRSVSACGRQR
jgi:asparagine synthase (glutamine-hydrolysing)